jgi:hypothetical protein
MADFARLIDWPRFASRNISDQVIAGPDELMVYACADDDQAIAWVLRGRDLLESDGELPFRPLLCGATLEMPPMVPGDFVVTCVETANGHTLAEFVVSTTGGPIRLDLPPFRHDLAIAVRPRPRAAREMS